MCKGSGWLEILGCGMVDPNVLEASGIDSKEYSGYALGMGIERIANLKYRVKDLRLFSENDCRFLEEFEAAGLEILWQTRDLHNSDKAEGNVMTEYERNFSQKGQAICSAWVRFPAKKEEI